VASSREEGLNEANEALTGIKVLEPSLGFAQGDGITTVFSAVQREARRHLCGGHSVLQQSKGMF